MTKPRRICVNLKKKMKSALILFERNVCEIIHTHSSVNWFQGEDLRMEKSLKISRHRFTLYLRMSFRRASTSGKLTEISIMNAKGTILKQINVTFIVHFCLFNYSFTFGGVLTVRNGIDDHDFKFWTKLCLISHYCLWLVGCFGFMAHQPL